jgi:hypothetical protein
MPYRATQVSQDPLDYFMRHDEAEPHLRVSDVILRSNHSKKEVFARLIRMATNSQWSHSAFVSTVNDPSKGLENTFLIEAKTKGVLISSWRNEVMPYNTFTVGIKRPKLDWYRESPAEVARRDVHDPEDRHGIDFLRHVRDVALDQIHGLYDHKVVWELASLYVERVAQRHLGKLPQAAEGADKLAELFKKWDTQHSPDAHVMHFICSGLVQYSFFAALRFRLLQDLKRPEQRESALHNLRNMQHLLYREDPQRIMEQYVQRLVANEQELADPVPDDVQDLLKTALPADFHNSPDLEWRYIVLNGTVWQIDDAPTGYLPQSADEASVLAMIHPEHNPVDSDHDQPPEETEASEAQASSALQASS